MPDPSGTEASVTVATRPFLAMEVTLLRNHSLTLDKRFSTFIVSIVNVFMVQRYYTDTPIVNTLQPTGDEAETEPPIAFFSLSVSSRWSLPFHSPTAGSACAPCGDNIKSLQESHTMLAGIE